MAITDEQKQEFDVIVGQLNDEDSDTRRWAVYDLEKFPAEDIVTYLIAAAQDEHRAVREASSELLEAIPAEFTVRLLTPLLGHEAIEVRNLIAAVISKFGDDAVDALIDALEDGNEDVKKFSADVLGIIGSDKSVPGLAKAMYDEVANVGISATEALGKIKSPAALPYLMEAFETRQFLRRESAEAIGLIGDPSGAEYLSGYLLGISDLLVQYAIVDALGNAGDKKSLEFLEENINKLPATLHNAAILSLLSIANRENLNLLERDNVKISQIIEGLSEGSEEFQELLISQIIPDLDSEIFKKFSSSADKLDSKVKVALIKVASPENGLHDFCMEMVDHPDDWVAYSAIEQLPVFGIEVATPVIQRVLSADRNLPKIAAMRSIQSLGIPGAIEWLRPYLNSDDEDLKSMAEQVIGS